MNASVLVTFTIVMVTAMVSGTAVTLLTAKIRYCGRQRVALLLRFCRLPPLTTPVKRDIDEINRRENKMLSQPEALLDLYQMDTPLSESDVTNLPSAEADLLAAPDKRYSMLPLHFFLENCCRYGCALKDVFGLCR
ncbi:hypothetical protein LSH36_788g02011 [Paralvinella palmiformis]|uniref:Uncharacterized protein n=1 Tax=Paralvinella palmiformis TaxID=53620 RepID=A0AAD9J0K3_9ANNE|nr:hypothetical protein LSH36_788g02011 [Paralvinella palmiformis]